MGGQQYSNLLHSEEFFLSNVTAEHLRTIGLLDIFGFESFKVGD